MKKLLLFSTSTIHGSAYLEYTKPTLVTHFDTAKKVLFVPFARPSGLTHEAYTKRFADSLTKNTSFSVVGAHEFENTEEAIKEVDAIFIGGGNTFLLLKSLYEGGWIQAIKQAVEKGMPYAGSSAGSNVAGKTISTTNDMPIVYPPSFDALNLVPFNLNPHYLDPDTGSTHMGETRETRIAEFHTQNIQPVLGLREGNWLQVLGDKATVEGIHTTRLFRRDMKPIELEAGTDVSFLMT
jgi:dipeptidase E